jgi:hypothetical protein
MEATTAGKPFVQEEIKWARWVAVAAGLSALLFFVATFVSSPTLSDVREGSTADLLVAYEQDPSQAAQIPSVLRAISFLLMAAPLFYLFRAASNRSPGVRRQFIGFYFLGPVLIAAQILLLSSGFVDAGEQLVEQSPAAVEALGSDEDVDEDSPEEELADDLVRDSGTISTAQYIGLAGYLSFGIALFYAGMWSMRTGLLTRFSGSFAMALGVVSAIPFFSGVGAFGTVLLMAYLGFFFGRSVDSRPPAWGAGEAMPWPKPGEGPPPDPGAGGDVEGSGREVLEPPLPESGTNGDGEPPGGPPRKRKRR